MATWRKVELLAFEVCVFLGRRDRGRKIRAGKVDVMRCDGQVMDDAGFSKSEEDSVQRHDDDHLLGFHN